MQRRCFSLDYEQQALFRVNTYFLWKENACNALFFDILHTGRQRCVQNLRSRSGAIRAAFSFAGLRTNYIGLVPLGAAPATHPPCASAHGYAQAIVSPRNIADAECERGG